jgi:hypothetical protein
MTNLESTINALTTQAFRDLNKATKKLRGSHVISNINDPFMQELDTASMTDSDHMLYVCACETIETINSSK